ncbi:MULTISPECIES: alpha/beta fold hydrolase [unclassified Brevibacterium]|uniref:alpha/beta fold hydrolase n=1 Tax=unclassified Brevibacterium TaxID=2614124 RepID=UPI001092B98F|nr:alpha/beta hydrolase [Brevibacterium sp. S22]TGD33288.1 alpha/beta hydrolase [Brevibacterium sp. S22]
MADHHIVDLPEGTIHYRILGASGPPVVLLHGGGIDNGGWMWHWLAGDLAADHRVYVPDHPKHGRSWPWRARADQSGQENMLAAMMDHWGLDAATLIGLSLGSATSLGYALRNPERVHRLVLTSTGGLQHRLPKHELAWLSLRTPLSWLIGRSMTAQSMRRWVRTKVAFAEYVSSADVEALADLAAEELLTKRAHGGHMFCDWNRFETAPRHHRVNFMSRIPELTQPMLFVHGVDDAAVPMRYPREAAAAAPHGRLAAIQKAGHFAPVERPREYSAIVREFLTETDSVQDRPGR